MTLQSSGAISLNEIAAEFGGSAPHSMSEYLKGGDNVPTTLSGSATQAEHTSNGTPNNFGGVTGLTCVRTTISATSLSSTTTTQKITLTSGVYYDFTAKIVWIPDSGSEIAHGGYQMGSDRADSGVLVGVSVSATGLSNTNTNRDRGTFYNSVSQGTSFTGQPLLAVTDLARGGGRHANSAVVQIYITVTGIPSADTDLTFYPNADSSPSRNFGRSTFSSQSLTNSTTAVNVFTNSTGHDATIEGTTLANNATQIISATGDYDISHTFDVNANVPTSGKVSITNFYGGRKT